MSKRVFFQENKSSLKTVLWGLGYKLFRIYIWLLVSILNSIVILEK